MFETFRINKLEEYIGIVNQLQGYYFRGQSDGKNWKLIPKLFRIPELYEANGQTINDWITIENEMLKHFQRLAIKYLKNYSKNKLEWLLIA